MSDRHIYELPFGARLAPDGKARFRIWAPSSDELKLRINGNEPVAMRRDAEGWFEATEIAPAGSSYSFIMPDGMSVPDPASRMQAGSVHDESVVVDPGTYHWKNPDWSNRPWHEAIVYEVHPGAMGGFKGIEARLPDLVALGITAIELMPIADFPGKHNWGYDGVLPFAPDRAYGTPDELKSLVDTAHGLGLMVLLDVVYNHFGPDGAYLHVYAKEFFDPDVHTPWGAAIDFKRQEVRDYFTNNAIMWLQEYRFDGLRFDAVHAISPASFLPELAASIRKAADRPVHLILEHEGNKSSILRTGPDAPGFDAQWADDWHHCLHVLLTGESEGYYESFQQAAEQLAVGLAEGFVFQGQVSPHHKEARGEPSAHLPPTAFVMCLQNHDQIGNRAMGERLTSLAHPASLAAATTLLLMQPFIPMLFMGEEWGTKTPFLFFTDHNHELAELIREGRRKEFQHFAAFQDEKKRELIPDPNAEETFAASIPDPAEAETGDYRTTLDLHRALISLRKQHVTPGILGCRSISSAALSPQAVTASWLLGTGATLSIAVNFGSEAVELPKQAGALLFASDGENEPSLRSRCALVFLQEAS